MSDFKINPVGRVRSNEGRMFIEIDGKYVPALQGLDGFSHINVIWWCNNFDDSESREILEMSSPYKKGPAKMGIFATRSPLRPNPVAVTSVAVIRIDYEKGLIELAYIDADDNTPVLDIKPYTPSIDRVEKPEVPDWCRHWPKSVEKSGFFDWENEFN